MNPILLAAWIACQSFDLGSTAVALKNPALREGNPLGARTRTIKITVNVAGLFVYHKTHKPIIPIGFAASGCAAGTWNVRQLRKVHP